MRGAAVKRAWKPQEVEGVEGSGGFRDRGPGREGKSGSPYQGSRFEVSWCRPGMDTELVLRQLVH